MHNRGGILKRLMNFFFPVLLGMLFQRLYNMADAVIVGRFVGKKMRSPPSAAPPHRY